MTRRVLLLVLALALAPAGLAQEDPAARLAAALAEHREQGLELDDALARLGPLEGPALEALLDAVRRDPELRGPLLALAVPALGAAAEASLLRLWALDEVDLRRELLEHLAATGGEPTVAALGGALADPALGDAAARALSTLVARTRALAPPALARLREVAGAGGPGAGAALGALAELDGARALPELLAGLERPATRRASLAALARADRARPAWRLEDDEPLPGLRERLHTALGEAGAAAPDQLMALQALRVWGDLGSVEVVLQRVERDPALAAVGLQALAEIALVRHASVAEWRAWWAGVAPAWARYDELRAAVLAGGPEALAALPALARVPDGRTVAAIDELARALVGRGWAPPAPEVAEGCCQTLARLGLVAGATPLLRLLEDPSAPPAVKARAVWALGVLAGAQGSADPAAWRRVFPDALPPEPTADADAPAPAPSPVRRAVEVGARRRGGARVEGDALRPLPPGQVPTRVAALAGAPAPGPARSRPGTPDTATAAAPPAAGPSGAAPPSGSGRSRVLALAAIAVLTVVGLALLFGPAPSSRRLLQANAAGAATAAAGRRAGRAGAVGLLEGDGDDDVVSIQLSASGRFSAITVDGLEARAPAVTAPKDPATEALDAVVASIPRLADALVSISARLAGGPEDRRVLFRAGGDTPLEAALGALRALGGLVADVVVGLRGSGLDLLVYERAPVAPAPAVDDGSWRRLLTLVAHGVSGFAELEVRTGSVWRSVLERDDDAPLALARLGAMDPGAVEEVRARLSNGSRITLLDRRGAPRRAAESRWAELLEGLERHGHEVARVEADGAGGEPLVLFEATDQARLRAAREALRAEGAGAGPFVATLRGSGIEVPLPDDPADRDAVLADLGLDALASVSGPAAPLFAAEDGPRLRHTLEALTFGGPARHRAVRALLHDGRRLTHEAPAAAVELAPLAPERPRAESILAAELPEAASTVDPLEAELERLQAELARLGPALTGLSAKLLTGAERRTLLRPGEQRRPAFEALRALAPLLEEVTATVAGCGLELLVARRAAAAPATPAAGGDPDLRGLEGALAAFEVVEVRELGRLWRTIQDADTDRVDAVQALGALSTEAVQEIRARTRSGTRATLFRRDGEGSDGSGAGWAAMLGDLHRLAPTLLGLDVALKGAPPRALFEGTDPARFAAARAALRAGEPLSSARVALRGTDVVLPLPGTPDEVDGALLELGLGTIARLVVDGPDGAERLLFEAEDGPRFAAAIEALVRQRADVVEVRARVDGEAAPRLLYPRPA